jgi:hypothetical protein
LGYLTTINFQYCLDIPDESINIIHHYWDNLDDNQLSQIHCTITDIDVWFDYTCMPQKPRTTEEEKVFLTYLNNINEPLENGFFFPIWDGSEINRSWCVFEFMIGEILENLVINDQDIEVHIKMENLTMMIIENYDEDLSDLFKAHDISATNGSDNQLIIGKIKQFLEKYSGSINPTGVTTNRF